MHNFRGVSTRPTRVLAVQPNVLPYRYAFWELATHRAALMGFDLRICHAAIDHQSQVVSGVGDLPNSHTVSSIQLMHKPFRLSFKNSHNCVRAFKPQLIVLQHALGNLETYWHILHESIGGPRVAWWGHGSRSFDVGQPQSKLASLDMSLARRGDWYFAYTERGANYLARRGYSRSRISVVQNTFDTDTLRNQIHAISDEELRSFQEHHELTPGRTVLFIGTLSTTKGVPTLLHVAKLLKDRIPGFHLLMGGTGPLEANVRYAADSSSHVTYLGRLDGTAKAVALRAADLLLIPRAIGLIAVDSLVAGVPIVTAYDGGHGPEVDYLTDERTSVFTEGQIDAYADAVADLLMNPAKLSRLSENCRIDSRAYRLDAMASNFIGGLQAWSKLYAVRHN